MQPWGPGGRAAPIPAALPRDQGRRQRQGLASIRSNAAANAGTIAAGIENAIAFWAAGSFRPENNCSAAQRSLSKSKVLDFESILDQHWGCSWSGNYNHRYVRERQARVRHAGEQ